MSQQTPLVVVTAATKTYERFVGNQRTHSVTSDYLLYPEEVEQFRTNPDAMLDEEETAPALA